MPFVAIRDCIGFHASHEGLVGIVGELDEREVNALVHQYPGAVYKGSFVTADQAVQWLWSNVSYHFISKGRTCTVLGWLGANLHCMIVAESTDLPCIGIRVAQLTYNRLDPKLTAFWSTLYSVNSLIFDTVFGNSSVNSLIFDIVHAFGKLTAV